MSFFMGPLISLFWISGDVFSGVSKPEWAALFTLGEGICHTITTFGSVCLMTFLHLNIYAWVASNTLLYPWLSFNIQAWWPFCTWTFMHEVPSTIPLYPWFSFFNIQAWWPFCTGIFMYESPPAHHSILGSISTFKCDDLSALEYLRIPSTTPKECKKKPFKISSNIHA